MSLHSVLWRGRRGSPCVGAPGLRLFPAAFFAVALLMALTSSPAEAHSEELLRLDTGTGSLFGTLSLPAAREGKIPVVVLVAGSGPTDRDGNNAATGARNDAIKLLAQGLAESGIASLRYDKRGVAASRAAGTQESDLRFDHYVEDAAGWVKSLVESGRFSSVGLAGHSEGALIAMQAAQRQPVDWLVSIASAAVGAADILRQQLRRQLPPPLAAENERILSLLASGKPASNVPTELNALYRESVQPYLISWFARVPAGELSKIRVPRLLVHGETDIQVDVDEARRLLQVCPGCELRIIEGMNHVLKRVDVEPNAQFRSYGDPKLPVMPELIAVVSEFIKRVVPHRQ